MLPSPVKASEPRNRRRETACRPPSGLNMNRTLYLSWSKVIRAAGGPFRRLHAATRRYGKSRKNSTIGLGTGRPRRLATKYVGLSFAISAPLKCAATSRLSLPPQIQGSPSLALGVRSFSSALGTRLAPTPRWLQPQSSPFRWCLRFAN